jgi:hypothetical protein
VLYFTAFPKLEERRETQREDAEKRGESNGLSLCLSAVPLRFSAFLVTLEKPCALLVTCEPLMSSMLYFADAREVEQ